jgi:hypothetical protein
VARREVTLPAWAAVLLPAIIGLVGSLIGAGLGVWQAERQADLARHQRVVDRDLPVYSEVTDATRRLQADWDANIQLVGPPPGSDDPLSPELLLVGAPSDVQALLLQDTSALREATARVDLAGSREASHKAGDLGYAAGHMTFQLNLHTHPELSPSHVPSALEIGIARSQLKDAYDKFLAVARSDTSE